MEDCDAMNMIDKLNQEFDEVTEKNIQLEKVNLELHKEIHKLKFKIMIDDPEETTYIGYPGDYYGQDLFDWSDELDNAVEFGLEKNIILKEIYFDWEGGIEDWEGFGNKWIWENLPEIDENGRDENGDERLVINTFEGGVYH